VIPDTRPDTAFIDGICSACIAYAGRPKVDWQARKEQLLALLARARSVAKAHGNHYDVIVPSSGGKDSHYQVLQLLELGARPLVVTATTCHLTPIGRLNIDNLARYATTIEYSPNKQVRAKLNRIGLREVGDVSWPEHVSIFTIPFLVARRAGIPFLFYGENPQNQYGAPSIEQEEAMQLTARWRSEFGGFLGLRPQDLIGVEGLTEADLADYILPEGATVGIEAHFLGQYIPWDSHYNAEIARRAGMRQQIPGHANVWEHENLDNAQTGLHDHMMYRKYGFGRGAAQISVDIRAKRIDREQALRWVERCDGIFPWEYAGVGWKEMCAHIDLHPITLHKALEDFTNWHIFQDKGEPGTWRPTLA
jgi:N-acetyl sugar amidotransferase